MMGKAWMLLLPLLSGGLLAVLGCGAGAATMPRADAPSARVDEPIGLQMMRLQPQLRSQRFNNLVSFEAPSDTVFVTPVGGIVERGHLHAHTGRYSLRSDAPELRAKISSLVPPDSFPGKWTLVGGYVYAPHGATIAVGCQIGPTLVAQRKVTVPPRRWTPVMVDVSPLSDGPRLVERGATSELVLQIESESPLWLDDLMLIDNTATLFGSSEAGGDGSLESAWSIQRRGLHYIIRAPGRFSLKLLTAEAGGPDGWTPLEMNAARARFSAQGRQKALTVYPDGRAYWDGSYRPLSAAAAEPPYLQQHLSPAQVEVAEELGRLDRDTPGDADNDGYNESRGAYQIRATGPRLEIAFTPRTAAVMRPVFEITGMPAGKALVTIEGRLVEQVMRLDDETLLIDIPARINRATTLNVKVQ